MAIGLVFLMGVTVPLRSQEMGSRSESAHSPTMSVEKLQTMPLQISFGVNGDEFRQRDQQDIERIIHFVATNGGQPAPIKQADTDKARFWVDYLSRPHPSVKTLERYFAEAAEEFGVPAALLMAIGQVESNWTQIGPSIDQGWGVMHLVQNNYADTLTPAAQILGLDPKILKDDPRQNIRGAAALLAQYAGPDRKSFSRIESWIDAVLPFTGLINERISVMQAKRYFELLKTGSVSVTLWNEKICINNFQNIDFPFIDMRLAERQQILLMSSDYPSAITNLTSCNFASGRTHALDTWVNHWVGTGTYAGAISWFLNCSSSVSAHFVIRSSDGEITQVVRVSDTAWHAGAVGYPNNNRSIGVEHEATAANPGLWNSAPMLQASANMARYFCDLYGIPKTRSLPGIRGHNEMPGTSTTCPGTLPWNTWMSYLNGSPSPSNDNCSNATLLFSNSTCSYTFGSVLGAASSGLPKPPCDGFSTPNMFDVWYQFTATNSSHVVTVTPSTSLGDPVVSVYSSCSGSPVGCRDAGSEGVSEVLSLSGLTVGNTYFVRIYDYGSIEPTGSNADFQICVTGAALVPTIGLSATTMTFNAPQGGGAPLGQNLTISNTGSGTLNWTVSSDASWLVPASTSGTAPSTLSVFVNNTLSAGTYYGTLTIAASGASNSPRTVAVTFVVSPPPLAPTIGLSATTMTFNAPQGGGSPLGQNLTISNTGSGTLNWTASSDASWLVPTSTSGTAPSTLSVSVNNTLSAGTYYGTLTIAAAGASNSPRTVAVTFVVSPPPCYMLSTVTSPGGVGAVTVNTGPNCSGGYTPNTGISLTANTPSGYVFSGWSGGGGSFTNTMTNPTIFTISGNAIVTAAFTPVAKVIVTVSPASIGLFTGEVFAFSATLTNAANSEVHWSASLGSIDNQGRYTAPNTPGTATISAISVQDPTSSGRAMVTIRGADFDGNGVSNPKLLGLANAIGSQDAVDLALYDFNGDGVIDNADLLKLWQKMGW